MTQQDEWSGAQEVKSSWFKFLKIGDGIKGTLINKYHQESNADGYQSQWVYEIKKSDGEVWNVGVAENKSGTIQRLNRCKMGEIIGIRFESEGEKKKGKFPAKNLTVYSFGQDPSYMVAQTMEAEELDNKTASEILPT